MGWSEEWKAPAEAAALAPVEFGSAFARSYGVTAFALAVRWLAEPKPEVKRRAKAGRKSRIEDRHFS